MRPSEFFTAPDKRLHLKLGLALAVGMLADLLVAMHVSGPLALVLGALGMAIGVEMYQHVRREGVASYSDAFASALPGLLLAAAWQGAIMAGLLPA